MLVARYSCGYIIDMNRLSREKRVSIVKALCEGCSINSTARMTGVAKTSILRLLLDLGRVCMNHEDRAMRGLLIREIEADEIWGFNHCKAKTLPRAKTAPEAAGDVWTWYAIDRNSKAILSWIMGDRDESHAYAFMQDLASRIVGRPDLTTDGLGVYRDAVFDAFHGAVDYAQVHKVYQNVEVGPGRVDAVCAGCDKRSVFGSPKIEKAGTSRVERANLTLRMSQRRWTRKTNAHSKKFENMQAAFALHACFYNWARPHASLNGKTPAMVLGIADRAWTVADLVGLLEADEVAVVGTDSNKRGPYRPRKTV
ncbi:MAG: IS1 family transposase [Phycisphaerales bacterium]|nr:IS1 family transposase [Phycisphaerales bacterium]